MVGFIKNQAANAVFFCLQGQITVFLISFFGSRATSVAEVGALGRLAMIFAVMGQLLTNIFVPAFARCQSAAKLRLQYFAQPVSVRSGEQILTSTARTSSHGCGHGYECTHRGNLVPERVEGVGGRSLALHPSYACDTNRAYSLHRFLECALSIDIWRDLQRAESFAEHGPELSRVSNFPTRDLTDEAERALDSKDNIGTGFSGYRRTRTPSPIPRGPRHGCRYSNANAKPERRDRPCH